MDPLQKIIESIKSQERTWKDSGFDMFGQRLPAPPDTSSGGFFPTDAIQAIIESRAVDTSQLGNIDSEKIKDGVSDLVQITGISSIDSGSVANNSGVGFTSTINDSKEPTRIMLGICECTAYKDTATNGNQVPYGSDAIANGHKLHTAYDLYKNQITTLDGQALSYFHHVQNNSGGPDNYIFVLRWRYVGRPGIV